ncbi:MAG: BrnT family toxin [Vulcanimicrobiaceae bacterium]
MAWSDDDFDGFEWDEEKSAATAARRGVDFVAAAKVFEGFFTEREDTRQDYGEQRFVVTGEVDGAIITVVWTPRGRNRRIITTWPASDQERRAYLGYRAIHEQGNPEA